VPPSPVVVIDTSTLIDLVDVDLLDVILLLPGKRFVIPKEVRLEIRRGHYRRRVDELVDDGRLEILGIEDPSEIRLKEELTKRFGQGEAACMAVAIRRQWYLACEERGRAFQREVKRRQLSNRVVRLEELLWEVVDSGLLSTEQITNAIDEACIKFRAENHLPKVEHLSRIKERFMGR